MKTKSTFFIILIGLATGIPPFAACEEEMLMDLSLESLMAIPLSRLGSDRLLPVDENPGFVEVLQTEEMRKRGATTLLDALELAPGIEVTRSERNVPFIHFNGMGNYLSSYLLKVNGMDLRSLGFSDAATFLYLPLESVESVDVIRGPGATLHGENAMFGVLDVKLKQNENSVFTGYDVEKNRVTAGSNMSTGAEDGSWSLHGNFHVSRQDGAEENNPSSFLDTIAGGVYRGLQPPPYPLNDSLQLMGGGLTFVADELDASFYVYRAGRGDGYGLFGVPSGKSDPRVEDLHVVSQISRTVQLTPESRIKMALLGKYSNVEVHSTRVLPPGFLAGAFLLPSGEPYPGNPGALKAGGDVEEYRIRPSVQWIHELNEQHEVRTKLEWVYSEIFHSETTVNYDPETLIQIPETILKGDEAFVPLHQRHQVALTLEDRLELTPSDTLYSGGRLEYYDDLDETVFSPRVAWLHDVSDAVLLKLQFAMAHHVPTSADVSARYRPLGNPDLKPIMSKTWEAGMVVHPDPGTTLRLTAQYSLVEDLFTPLERGGVEGITQVENQGELTRYSLTGEWNQRISARDILVSSLTWNNLDADIDDNSDPSFYLPWFGDIAWIHSWNDHLSSTLQGRYQDTYATLGTPFATSVPSRFETDIVVEFTPENFKGLSIMAAVRNVTDEEVTSPTRQLPDGFRLGGRTFSLSAKMIW